MHRIMSLGSLGLLPQEGSQQEKEGLSENMLPVAVSPLTLTKDFTLLICRELRL